MNKVKILFIPLIMFYIIGCGMTEDKKNAEILVKNLYDSIKKKDFKKTITFYSQKFFNQTPEYEWIKILKKINKKLGNLKSYELKNWNVKKQANTTGSGTYIVLIYEVIYSKYKSIETLNIFKPIGGKMEIVGHHINSDGFIE